MKDCNEYGLSHRWLLVEPEVEWCRDCGIERAASCDTRRMAETGNTDSVRSTGGAVDAEGSETPKGHHP